MKSRDDEAPRPAASAAPGNILETHILSLHPGHTES